MPPKRSRPLEDYQRKRDFERTPEPQPKAKASATGRLFVVQKHRARQLHYDFRLELDGVLLSWAVPKGPSLDPSEKRLAVQTEDHPIDYGAFEGIIPEDEYGGGTVMLWDRGEWSFLSELRASARAASRDTGDAREALRKGTLKFKLDGRKLRGAWTLVQMKEKGAPTRNWLLIKERDEEVRDEGSFSIIDQEPFSAASGRTINEIASAKDNVWTDRGAQGALPEIAVGFRRGLYRPIDLGVGEVNGAKKAKMPLKPGLLRPTAVDSVPEGDGWLHEILQVGERVACFFEDRSVVLQSATGEDWTSRLPLVARAISRLPAAGALLDGMLSSASGDEIPLPPTDAADLQYNIFDLLFCDGYDLRAATLKERKRLLAKLLEHAGPPLVYCDHVEGKGKSVIAEAKRLGAPGIVSKRVASKYSSKESESWIAVRIRDESEAPSPKPRRARGATDEPDVSIAGIKLTNPARVLYPEERVTKRMLAEYFEAVAPWMLPHVASRPLSLYRCPGGIEKDCFFQKQLGEMPSKHIRGAKTGDDPYVVLEDVHGLVTLAQWNVLEIHGWGCRENDLDHPDILVFDLDPGPNVPWPQIVEGAKGLRLLLEELGLESFVKTSGGKGLHVVVPLVRRQDGDEVKDFAARVARRIVDVAPKHFTVFMSKPERRGKVFIDYHRNHRGSTCVAPYSTRARPGAQVSTPISWEELEGPQPRFHIFEVLQRLALLPAPQAARGGAPRGKKTPRPSSATKDPWSGFFDVKQSISRDAVNWLRG